MSPANAQTPRAIFDAYEIYLKRAEACLSKGDLDAAATFAAVSAHVALCPHPGFFAAPRLERVLNEIGRLTTTPDAYRRPLGAKRKIRSLLHVATELTAVGGLTNMLGRWIKADAKRLHSVALTAQRGLLQGEAAAAVRASGGEVHRLNVGPGGLIAHAQRLRALARQFDAVVLHVYSQDVVPSIAFSEAGGQPPIIFLNHGDHLFWLGASSSDIVINLRDAAHDLTIARRGVEARRNIVVPTLIAPPSRTRSREEAKRALGLGERDLLLFSAARAMKYRTVDGRTFADAHVELLQRHPHAQLWALGAGEADDWRPAIAATGGRIRPLPESRDTQLYFEAADIYVDSFPFVSSTSMMEAAGLGTPMVSRFYGPKEARIFAINHPGIDAVTLHASNEAAYVAQIERLIVSETLRAERGELARQSVLRFHTAPSWLDFIERAYALALELAPISPRAHLAERADESFACGEPDDRLYDVFGYGDGNLAKIAAQYVGLMPASHRLGFWRELRSRGAFANALEACRALAPAWVAPTLKRIHQR